MEKIAYSIDIGCNPLHRIRRRHGGNDNGQNGAQPCDLSCGVQVRVEGAMNSYSAVCLSAQAKASAHDTTAWDKLEVKMKVKID